MIHIRLNDQNILTFAIRRIIGLYGIAVVERDNKCIRSGCLLGNLPEPLPASSITSPAKSRGQPVSSKKRFSEAFAHWNYHIESWHELSIHVQNLA